MNQWSLGLAVNNFFMLKVKTSTLLEESLCEACTEYGLSVLASCRQGSTDLLEENVNEQLHRESSVTDNSGVTGAAPFDGEKTAATRRPRGRKGMEGMLVRHDKRFLTMLQDFYVACLKVDLSYLFLVKTMQSRNARFFFPC